MAGDAMGAIGGMLGGKAGGILGMVKKAMDAIKKCMGGGGGG